MLATVMPHQCKHTSMEHSVGSCRPLRLYSRFLAQIFDLVGHVEILLIGTEVHHEAVSHTDTPDHSRCVLFSTCYSARQCKHAISQAGSQQIHLIVSLPFWRWPQEICCHLRRPPCLYTYSLHIHSATTYSLCH